jgi:hypothetical protein
MPFSSSQTPCPEKRKGPHLWSEKCSKCSGTHKIPCRSCKAPWRPLSASHLTLTPCALCASSGFLHSGLKTLCPACYGVGRTLGPLK